MSAAVGGQPVFLGHLIFRFLRHSERLFEAKEKGGAMCDGPPFFVR
jgi:hypothetical protein